MADQSKKDEQEKVARGAGGKGNGGTASRPDVSLNERLNAILLAIVEREIGRGEPRRPQEWQMLRELAVGHPSGPQLVDTFEEVVERANREMVARFGAPGVDLTRIRGSVVTLIRISLAKKLGLAAGTVKES